MDEATESEATEETSPQKPVQQNDSTADSAFSYEAAKQRLFYAREATIEDFDS